MKEVVQNRWTTNHPSKVIQELLRHLPETHKKSTWADSWLCTPSTASLYDKKEQQRAYICANTACRFVAPAALFEFTRKATAHKFSDIKQLRWELVSLAPITDNATAVLARDKLRTALDMFRTTETNRMLLVLSYAENTVLQSADLKPVDVAYYTTRAMHYVFADELDSGMKTASWVTSLIYTCCTV